MPPPHADSEFLPTRWTVVLAAAGDDAPARQALDQLAHLYWYPLYAFVRRQGYAPPDAEDLTQGFFAILTEKQFLADVDPARGRFRAFLLACLKHFLSHERDKARTLKRGGGRAQFSLDAAEERYAHEAVDPQKTPEKLFERQWALAVLDQVLRQLEADYARQGHARLFDTLRPTLTTSPTADYAALAPTLGMTPSGVKTAVHRLRRRYRDRLRRQIAQTVDSPEEVDAEIAYLLACL